METLLDLSIKIAPSSTKTGRFAILEQFLADGIHYIFGNPGTVEQGFLDALSEYPQLKYILALQESCAIMMADGYVRATQKPAVVQIHSAPGLGNAIGSLYQAKRGHAPLIVIGGDAGIKYQAMDAQMAADLVAFAKPVTKWSTMVMHPSSLLRVLRRAIKIARTPPMGPVYVCLPMDILDSLMTEEVFPTSNLETRVVPEKDLLNKTALLLASAKTPMIFVGDGIAYSQGQDELTRVAEILGAEVWEADAGELNMSHQHPLYQGMTGHMFGSESLAITQKGDVNLICGTYVLPEVFPELGNIFAKDSKCIHIDLNVDEIAKNHPVDMALVSDPKITLAHLADILEISMTQEQRKLTQVRYQKIKQKKETATISSLKKDQLVRGALPLQMSRFMEELMLQIPTDTIIFDEAITNSPIIERYFSPFKTGQYFLTRGGSLGVGIPGAIGVKIANPDKLVIGFTGDGGSMYTIQSLWSAARHEVNAKFVICDNSSYHILQLNLQEYWKERSLPQRPFPLSFDLSFPKICFAKLAHSMQVAAVRIEKPEEIASAIRQMIEHSGPFLIHLCI